MLKSFLDYPLTRPITLSLWLNLLIIVVGIIWIVIITIVNVIAVGYELVPFTSTSFNSTNVFWYDRLVPTKSLLPQSRNCSGSIIKISEAISSNITGFFAYTLLDYIDPGSDASVDGMMYENTVIKNCSVYNFWLVQPVADGIHDDTWIVCNTSATQTFAVGSSRDSGSLSLSLNAANSLAYQALSDSNSSQKLNISVVVAEWSLLAAATLGIVAPAGQMSIFVNSVASNNLSSIRLAYFSANYILTTLTGLGYVSSAIPNTPANDYWTFYLGYTPLGQFTESWIAISFLPTGEIDWGHTSLSDFEYANNLIAPTINVVRIATGDPSFDVWKLMNWLMVSYYWIWLYDFGEVAPTYYNYTTQGLPNFTAPLPSKSTNNIFVNETLFEIYSSYLRQTIFPFLATYEPGIELPEFLPLNDENTLHPVDMSLLRSYSCTERRPKGWVSLVISVMTADYALIFGMYHMIKWIAGWWHNRGKNDANVCEGCVGIKETGEVFEQLIDDPATPKSGIFSRYG